jgi:hypothetical protein
LFLLFILHFSFMISTLLFFTFGSYFLLLFPS